MSVTYFVALPFVKTDDGTAPGDPKEFQSENTAIRAAEVMSRAPNHVGALAFKRSGDPNLGNFTDATVLRTFGNVPENLDEL